MIKNKKISFVFVGLALFSMFFGSGNLIFPMYVGQIAKDHCLLASLGFLLTAVAVPFLGVVAMIVYRGDYNEFFQVLGKRMGFLMITLLLAVWIPFGSAPRCVTLAHSSLSSYFDVGPLWLFSLMYCTIIYFLVGKKSRMLDMLGYILTPLLLGCMAVIVFKGVNVSEIYTKPTSDGLPYFGLAVKEAFNTMDLIASFFFSASVIQILNNATHEKSQSLKLTLKACTVGIILLGVVYVSLIGLAASHYELLANVPKDKSLAEISKHVLGPQMGIIAVFTIFLACFTTSIAMVVVYAEFLHKTLFKNQKTDRLAKIITTIVTFGISLMGLKGITMITSPILEVCYPLLVVLIFVNLARKWMAKTPKVVETNAELLESAE